MAFPWKTSSLASLTLLATVAISARELVSSPDSGEMREKGKVVCGCGWRDCTSDVDPVDYGVADDAVRLLQGILDRFGDGLLLGSCRGKGPGNLAGDNGEYDTGSSGCGGGESCRGSLGDGLCDGRHFEYV